MPASSGELVGSLARLPAKQRATVILFYYADYPISQIAKVPIVKRNCRPG